MIQPTKLMRGLILAFAFLGVAPLAGANLPVVGVQAVAAQEQLVSSVLFEGNRRFSDAQLQAMVDVATTGIYTPQRANADAESIRQAYVRDGFNGVSVSPRVEAAEAGRVRVTFVVNEGDRAGIAAINFTGNNSISAGNLKGAIRTKESGILSWLFRDDSYDEQKLAIDRELIRLYYSNRGFPDVQVTSVAEFDASRNAYFINFTVNEGERYSFGNVGIETSIPGLNADVLRSAIQTSQGSNYSISNLQDSVQDMAFEATAQGYAFADVRPRLERDIANRTFNVTYLVDEGARIYVERINVTGNEKTRDFVVRRELGFAEGDPFNRSMVNRAREEIMDLGFFSAVDISTQPGSAPDQVVINIALTEQSTGEYGATVGYSTSDGVLGELSLTERNFLGRGQYLRAAIGASENGQTFDFSFTEPHFMGLDIATGVDVYHRIVNETTRNFYGYQATGGQLRVGVPLTSSLSVTGFGGLERKVIDDTDTFDDDDNDATPEVPDPRASAFVDDGDEVWKYFVGYTLTYNGVDDRRNPTSGLLATFTQQYVGWDFNLLKTEARARYYMPLIEDSGIIASVRGQAGVIHALGDDGVHPLEAFYPGSQLVRGFQSRGMGPRLLTSGEPVGTTMYAGISAEIEFPVPVLPETYGLSGAVWADAGWIGDAADSFGLPIDPASENEPLRTSVGASIIWDSPFGPLRGDFAHVLSESDTDRTQVFQLTMQNSL
ncbi:outer membrane protein assembly factor BamA [Devosia nitrariae]|uniref:Outer membrane protein assembly factor BamA n=1 Tax=Devosia nitrariae TaxID=2071872 RepID=A0ABQ5WCE9_9HYPH|nr:outer membrane protein assembly factor BamA [Devosia nitrariae]GLQ57815.1 outer membrane protein assembly factor BamA [Devosia nitrariae]